MPQRALFLEFLDFDGLLLEWRFGMEELPESDALARRKWFRRKG
jgi:hypothetical protein